METKALFAITAMCVLAGCSGGYGPTDPSPADSTYSAGYTFILAGLAQSMISPARDLD